MCTYSMMVDSLKTIHLKDWTTPIWSEAKQILEAIKKLDEKLGQKDCEDPKKAEWMQEVENRLSKLEDSKVEQPIIYDY